MDEFDLVNALLKPKGLQLKQMWRDGTPGLDDVETEKMNVYILQVMSILRQGYCSPKYLYFLLPGRRKPIRDPDGKRRKEILIPDIDDFETRWKAAVDALEGAIKVLKHPQEYGAVSLHSCPMYQFFLSLRLACSRRHFPLLDNSTLAESFGIGTGHPCSTTDIRVRLNRQAPVTISMSRHGSTMMRPSRRSLLSSPSVSETSTYGRR